MNDYILEVCVDSVESALSAKAGGATRLELCANLIIGGTTPGYTLFQQVQQETGLPIRVLIRPRFGDFLYTAYEYQQMCADIRFFCQCWRRWCRHRKPAGGWQPERSTDARHDRCCGRSLWHHPAPRFRCMRGSDRLLRKSSRARYRYDPQLRAGRRRTDGNRAAAEARTDVRRESDDPSRWRRKGRQHCRNRGYDRCPRFSYVWQENPLEWHALPQRTCPHGPRRHQ